MIAITKSKEFTAAQMSFDTSKQTWLCLRQVKSRCLKLTIVWFGSYFMAGRKLNRVSRDVLDLGAVIKNWDA